LNREWQFHAKSHELIDAFLVRPPDWAQGPSLLCAEHGLPLPVDASEFPTLVGKFTQQPLCTILLWQIEIFNQNRIFL